MPRPILTRKVSNLFPGELWADATAHCAKHNISMNNFIIGCMERELMRFAMYHLCYYRDLRPLLKERQPELIGCYPVGEGK